MKINEKELRRIIRESIMENMRNNSLSDDIIVDGMDRYLRRLKEECDFVNMCVSVSYPQMREIILKVISECGISYSNISYKKYDDNVYMLILNNCEVNIEEFINATNSNIEDYDLSDASQVVEYLHYYGSSALEWKIKEECKSVREFSIYDLSFSRDGKTCAIYIELPFDIED
jgi:hypothetical protein